MQTFKMKALMCPLILILATREVSLQMSGLVLTNFVKNLVKSKNAIIFSCFTGGKFKY